VAKAGDATVRMLKQIVNRAPRPRFAEHHNGGGTKAKDRLFLAAREKGIERTNLNDSSNRQGSDLYKCEPSEVAGFQNVDHALVAEEDVRLAQ
jgi:hypothetical protein